MCQLILRGDVVEDVLEDGVLPGKKVVVGAWNSAPRRGWQIIDLPGVPAARLKHLRDVDGEIDVNGDWQFRATRKLLLDRTAMPAEKVGDLETLGRAIFVEVEVTTRTGRT